MWDFWSTQRRCFLLMALCFLLPGTRSLLIWELFSSFQRRSGYMWVLPSCNTCGRSKAHSFNSSAEMVKIRSSLWGHPITISNRKDVGNSKKQCLEEVEWMRVKVCLRSNIPWLHFITAQIIKEILRNPIFSSENVYVYMASRELKE